MQQKIWCFVSSINECLVGFNEVWNAGTAVGNINCKVEGYTAWKVIGVLLSNKLSKPIGVELSFKDIQSKWLNSPLLGYLNVSLLG